MELNIKEVMNGSLDGHTVWICHYNRPDSNKKPLRNVPPTMVLVRSNEELPKGKTVYYSQSHFCAIGSNGNVTSKIISPVDNTGYRSYCGNTLHVFDTEWDCNAAWNEQLQSHIDRLDDLIKNAARHWEDEKRILVGAIKITY